MIAWVQAHRKDILVGGVLLLLPVLFCPELAAGIRSLVRLDLDKLHYPLRAFAAQNWQSGTWPLWDPYLLCGFPLLAEAQIGVLYPLSALFLLPIPSYLALNWLVLANFGLAAAFTYAAARSFRLSRAAAVLAALSYGFGGTITAQSASLNIMSGMAWIPLVLCFTFQSAERAGLVWPILGGAALALQILASQPQIAVYTALVTMAYTAYHMLRLAMQRQPLTAVIQPGLRVALAGLLGLGLAAPQILPTAELTWLSVRSTGLSYTTQIALSLHPIQLIEVALPTLFGNNLVGYDGLNRFEESFSYFGLAPLFLSAAAWRRHRDPRVRFLFLFVPLAIALAFGGYTPVYALLQNVPGYNLFRAPGRWMIFVSLAVALLAGYGLDELRRAGAAQAAKIVLAFIGVVSLLLLALTLASVLARPYALAWVGSLPVSDDTRQLLTLTLSRLGASYAPRASSWRLRLFPWLLAPGLTYALPAPVIVGLLIALIRKWLKPAPVARLLVAVAFLDMLVVGGTSVLQSSLPSHWSYDRQIIALVKEKTGSERTYYLDTRSDDEMLVTPDDMGRGIGWLRSYTPAMFGVSTTMSGYGSPLSLSRFAKFQKNVPPAQASNMMSLKTWVTWDGLPAPQARSFDEIAAAGRVHVYLNPLALPRAYVAHSVQSAADGPAALRLVSAPDFDPHLKTVLEQPAADAAGSGAGITPAPIRSYSPLRVVVEAQADRPGWLVLTDTWYPGWRAYVDGRETPIRPANYLFRAVPVSAGRHTVEFVYFADAFKLGLCIAGLTAALLAAGLAFAWRRRPDQRAPSTPRA